MIKIIVFSQNFAALSTYQLLDGVRHICSLTGVDTKLSETTSLLHNLVKTALNVVAKVTHLLVHFTNTVNYRLLLTF